MSEIPYFPTDWRAQCEARCRKSGKRCPHVCRAQIPNTIASHPVMDEHYHMVAGRPVNLCQGHCRSWNARAKRLLSLPLIAGGHLSPYNEHGYGSIIVAQDRLDFARPVRVKIPPAWGVIGSTGRVPAGLLERLPRFPLTPAPLTPVGQGRVLRLTLKRKWFDMVASGEKREEYRTPGKWILSRLEGKQYDCIEFKNGYGPNVPTMKVEYLGWSIDFGQLRWGAGFDELVVIRLGRVLSVNGGTLKDQKTSFAPSDGSPRTRAANADFRDPAQ